MDFSVFPEMWAVGGSLHTLHGLVRFGATMCNMTPPPPGRMLYEPTDPTSVPGHSVRSAWLLPPNWVTVREHAVSRRRRTDNVSALGAHGRATMALLRSVGVRTVPQVFEKADNGVTYLVNTYPSELLDQTVWQVRW